MKKIILVGGGGHCLSCVDVIESEGIFEIEGIVLPTLENSKPVLDYPVIGTNENLPELLKQTSNILICDGQITNSEIRKKHFEFLKKLGANFPIIRSPNAYCSLQATLGEGTILMHGSIVNANAQVGVNCIINSRSVVEHDVKIEDHCHISTGSIINGSAKLGMGSFIGSGAIIEEGIEIGKQVIIGAGYTVTKNIPNGLKQ